jgi:hypothetical protein
MGSLLNYIHKMRSLGKVSNRFQELQLANLSYALGFSSCYL